MLTSTQLKALESHISQIEMPSTAQWLNAPDDTPQPYQQAIYTLRLALQRIRTARQLVEHYERENLGQNTIFALHPDDHTQLSLLDTD